MDRVMYIYYERLWHNNIYSGLTDDLDIGA